MCYKKSDVQMHSDGFRPANPAVNVKAYSFPGTGLVVKAFGCSEDIAERALGWAFNTRAADFWEGVQSVADETCGGKACSEGRRSGWAVVHGLSDVDDWDAVALGKWRAFEKRVLALVNDACSWEQVREDIESNRWAEPNAEEYNFVDHSGKTVCLADVERCAHCG